MHMRLIIFLIFGISINNTFVRPNLASNNDFENIEQVLEYAIKNGLQNEIIWSALKSARDGNSVKTSLEFALKEWDI